MQVATETDLRLPLRPLIGAATFVLMLLVLVLVCAVLLPIALVKILVPLPAVSRGCTRSMIWIAGVCWVGTNRGIYRLLHGSRHGVSIDPRLDRHKSWLVICNHRSWADILLLLDALWLRAVFPRFFLKRELIWVPLIGVLCWAMDMPLMRRQSRRQMAANPRLARVDLEMTRRACARYRGMPVTVVNFLEGTRWSKAKHRARGAPFRHLLRPKSGGLALALGAMGDQFAGLVDVTIAYRPTRYGLVWSFLIGEQTDAVVRVRVRALPADLLGGDYEGNSAFRARFHAWVNDLWTEKDAELAELSASGFVL